MPHRDAADVRNWRCSSNEVQDMLIMKRQEAGAAGQAPQQHQLPGSSAQKGLTTTATQGAGLAKKDSGASLSRHGSASMQPVGSTGAARALLTTKGSQGSGQLHATGLCREGSVRSPQRPRPEPKGAPAFQPLAGPAAAASKAGRSPPLDPPMLGRLKTTASAPLPAVQQAAPVLAPRMSMPAAAVRDPRLAGTEPADPRLASPAASPAASPTQAAAAPSRIVWQPPPSVPGAALAPAGVAKPGAAPLPRPPPVQTAGARSPQPHAAVASTGAAPAPPPVDPRTGLLSPRLSDADATPTSAAAFLNPFAAAAAEQPPRRERAAAPEEARAKRKAAERSPLDEGRPAKHSRLVAPAEGVPPQPEQASSQRTVPLSQWAASAAKPPVPVRLPSHARSPPPSVPVQFRRPPAAAAEEEARAGGRCGLLLMCSWLLLDHAPVPCSAWWRMAGYCTAAPAAYDWQAELSGCHVFTYCVIPNVASAAHHPAAGVRGKLCRRCHPGRAQVARRQCMLDR